MRRLAAESVIKFRGESTRDHTKRSAAEQKHGRTNEAPQNSNAVKQLATHSGRPFDTDTAVTLSIAWQG